MWERLIQTTNRHLKVLIGNSIISEFALRNLFAEVEAIMNSGPVTAVSNDPRDLEALTTNYFLLQRKILDDLPVERALGVQWNWNRDTMKFRVVPSTRQTPNQMRTFVHH